MSDAERENLIEEIALLSGDELESLIIRCYRSALHKRNARIAELEAKLAAPMLTAEGQWQPIETAPKDQAILAGHRLWTRSEIVQWCPYGHQVWRCVRDDYCVGIPPTHWMPLTAPPAPGVAGKE